MRFIETPLAGAYVIELDRFEDPRGFFARSFCQREFEQHGLIGKIVQTNVSYNQRKGTLRGMHYQMAPHQETKLVRCTRGALFDVVVDLRPDSPTYRRWYGAELTEHNHRMMFVPRDFAHGFITLADETEATYAVSEFYTLGAERGARHDDPAFGIEWPVEVTVISDKDRNWPDFAD